MQKSKLIAFGVILYVICFKILKMLDSVIGFWGINNEFSDLLYYFSFAIALIFTLGLFKYFFSLGLEFVRKNKNSIYYIGVVAVIVAFLEQLLAFKLGVILGESISDIDNILAPDRIKGHTYVMFHLMLLIFYDWFFNFSEDDNV